FADALSRSDAAKWIESMKEEMRSLQEKGTWTLCKLPRGRKAIGVKWIFKIKHDGRYKSRLVAKGYSQYAGIDFDKTFAPVIRIEIVRILLAFALFRSLKVRHVDAKTAFLNSSADFEIYIEQPEGFICEQFSDLVLLLNKSLYGLKQAPRLWYLL